MDQQRMSAVTRGLRHLPSRRDVLLGLASTGLGLGALRRPSGAAAKHKRKHKHQHQHKAQRAKPNEFGCLNVGDACQNADQCCSGVCNGKKGKKACRAHGTGVCDQQAEGICTAANPNTTVCDNANPCACIRTTAGSNFCSHFNPDPSVICADCRKDADCVALGFPAGSACVPFGFGVCAHACQSGMACFPPCGVDFPTV